MKAETRRTMAERRTIFEKVVCAIIIMELCFPANILAAGESRPSRAATAPSRTVAQPVEKRATAVKVPRPIPVASKSSKVTVGELIGKPAAISSATTDSSAKTTSAETRVMAIAAAAGDAGGDLSAPQSWSGYFKFEPHSGSGTMAIPLLAPPGRGGIQPSLTLTYSARQANGPFGMGWSLPFGDIRRSTKFGPPKFDDSDTFIASLGGSQIELAAVGNGEYRAKTEGAFMKFIFKDNRWEAKDKNGTTYYFGLTGGDWGYESLGWDGASRISYWRLNEIKDIHGNFCFIKYFRDGSFEVLYTGEPGTDALGYNAASQNFQYRIVAQAEKEKRRDWVVNERLVLQPGLEYRIANILVYGGGNLMRKYAFDYAYSRRTGRSLLTMITEYGSDGVTAQKPIKFSYADDTDTAYSLTTAAGDPTAGDNRFNVRVNSALSWNGYIGPLYPHYYGSPDIGVFGSGLTVNWEPASTETSHYFNADDLWAQDVSSGRLIFRLAKNYSFYAWTYLYSKTAKTISLSSGGNCNSYFYMNYDYSNPRYVGDFAVKEGYNILEFTGYYHSLGDGRYSCDIFSAIVPQVDLMNSTQVIAPNLSADFNGDGITDLGTAFSDGSVKVALSNGAAFLPKTVWIENFGVGGSPLIGDFNADGKADLGVWMPASGDWRVALSDGEKFVPAGTWLSGFGHNFGSDRFAGTGDYNGDGLTDIMIFYRTADDRRVYCTTALNTGGKFYVDLANPERNFILGFNYENSAMSDFNGDGLIDPVIWDNPTGKWRAYVNLYLAHYYPSWMATIENFGADQKPVFADFNSDGAGDIGYFEKDTGKIFYKPVSGFDFYETREFPVQFGITGTSAQVQSGDYNGDGLTDLAVYNDLGQLEIAYSSGHLPDVLVKAQNGSGGETELVYKSSRSYANKYMPFAMAVLDSTTARTAQGDSYTTKYYYEGGYYNAAEREFYGFETVKVIDAEGNYSVAKFSQEDFYHKGLLLEQAQYDKAGKLYGKTVNQWETQDLGNNSHFMYLRRSDSYVYDGNSTGRRTAMVNYYEESPQLGNLTKAVSLGEVNLVTGEDTGSDTRTTEVEYLNNKSAAVWLLGLPKEKRIKDHSGAVVRKSRFFYDGYFGAGVEPAPVKGLLTQKKDWASFTDDSKNPVVKLKYDAWGNLIQSTDARNYSSTITFDPQYHLFPLSSKNALGHEVKTEYYGINGVALKTIDGLSGLWGQARSATDANSQKALTGYDVFGRAVKVVGPLDSAAYPTTIQEYLDTDTYRMARVKKRLNSGAAATVDEVSFYDGLGRLIQAKKPDSTSGRFIIAGQTEYNSRGLAVKSYFPRYTTKALEVMDAVDKTLPCARVDYDAIGRVIKSIAPDGTYSTTSYDDWTVSAIDPNGHKQKAYSDAYGRVTKREEYSGADGRSSVYPAQTFAVYATTNYVYDSEGGLLGVKDAKGNITRINYDYLGRKVSMDDPDMGVWKYDYDLNGNLLWQEDARGQRINFSYDSLNRLLTKTDGNTLNVKYVYDEPTVAYSKGRLTHVEYGSWPQDGASFVYDNLGREIQSTKRIDGVDYTVKRKYGMLQNLSYLEYPDGEKLYYYYDYLGRTRTIKRLSPQAAGDAGLAFYIKSTEYNEFGQVKKIVYGNDVTRSYYYYPLNKRLQRILSIEKGGRTLQDFNYEYDAAGNISKITDKVYSATQIFKYDHLSRLIEANGAAYGQKIYQYDQIGNFTNNSGVESRYGENGAGPHAITSQSNGREMEYDANGNMKIVREDGAVKELVYDSENRLNELRLNGNRVANYFYDGDGGRTKKTVYSAGAGQTTKFIGALAEESAGKATDFIYAGSQRIASVTAGEIAFFLDDHLGGANVVTDVSGAVKEIVEYLPYGEFSRRDKRGANTTSSGAASGRYFTGQKLDEEFGLYYYGARYYWPGIGRFISPDSIVQAPTDPQSLNRYAYCRNNPVNLVDPTGHKWSWKKFWNSFAGAFVGAIVTALTAGAGVALWAAGMYGGMVGGAITGGLNGGYQGALIGFAAGGVLGGLGGWGLGIAQAHKMTGWYIGGMLAIGAGVAGATDSWDSFTGGLTGGIVGGVTGMGINDAYHKHLAATDPDGGVKNTKVVEGRGVGTTQKKALEVANKTGSRVLYTPSRNVASDIVRGGTQLLFRNSLASRDFAKYVLANQNTTYNVHSEMTLTALGAAETIAAAGGKVSGVHFNLVSPFYSEATASNVFGAIGATFTYFPPNLADPAGAFATFAPVTAPIYGALGVTTLFHFHGYEIYKPQLSP